jgi:lysine-specific demethylase 8
MLLSKTKEERKRFFLAGDNVNFYSGSKFNSDLKPIYKDFVTPQFVRDEIQLIAFWVSFMGIKTWLHYDTSGNHNLNAQVLGSKSVLLFKPSEVVNLYMHPSSNFSRVNIFSPDYDQFPLLQNVEYYKADINSGDIIFIPGFWFHTFEHTGDININVNFWFKNISQTVHPLSVRLFIEKAFFKYHGVELDECDSFIDNNEELIARLQEIEKWLFCK